MRTTPSASERAHRAIAHHARECEDALRLADFAASDPVLGKSKIAEGLRRLAALESETAWSWIHVLTQQQGETA